MKIGIIGGGIIGLSSAYYLQKSGHEVTVIDQSDLTNGCSYGNAGMIVPSHFIPLAAPGMIAKGIRWMFDSSSPFYVKPRWSGDLVRWGIQFYRHATEAHVQKSAGVLKELSLLSKSLYQTWSKELLDFGYNEKGLLMLYQTSDAEHEEKETARLANQYGIEARVLSADEVQQLETHVRVNVRGGILFPGDAHLTPHLLMESLKNNLNEKANFKTNTAVKDFNISEKKIKSVVTNRGEFSFDEIILATGSWSGDVAKKLKLNLPMQAGKGYSFTLPDISKNIQIPSILIEGKVAVTPMGNSLRFGGTMEINGLDHSINMKRVKGIVDTVSRFYPELKIETPAMEKTWHGLRPCSPDGLPYIGRTPSIQNLTIATGHSMLGISLGPATGKLVSEIINGEKTSIDLSALTPHRYQR
ncbi:MAG: FAD-dependent oxidoreductase [Bacteroidetes bacterium]|nr:FAD-dependent oxidoreductase [Bacteroidota bacterium]